MTKRLAQLLSSIVFLTWLAFAFCLYAPASWLAPSESKRLSDILLSALFPLQLIDLVVGWRFRHKSTGYERPSEALIVTVVIGLIGLAGALATGWYVQSWAGYAVVTISVVAILISTAVLGVVAYRHASHNADHIGEARFSTTAEKWRRSSTEVSQHIELARA